MTTTVPVAKDNAAFAPSYSDVTVQAGEAATVEIDGLAGAPAGTKFAIKADVLDSLQAEGWVVAVDGSGRLTVTPPVDATAGAEFHIPVIVTYPDSTIDIAVADVIIDAADVEPTPNNAATYEPSYVPAEVAPGGTVTVGQTGEPSMPAGTRFEIDAETLPEGVTASVDPVTGAVTIGVPADAIPGTEINTVVAVTYPDGSTEYVVVTTTVGKPTPTTEPTTEPSSSSDGTGSSEAGIITAVIGGVAIGAAIIAGSSDLSSAAVIGGLPGFPGLSSDNQGFSPMPLPDVFVPAENVAPGSSQQDPAKPSTPAQPSDSGQHSPAQPLTDAPGPNRVVPAPTHGGQLANTGVQAFSWALGLGTLLMAMGLAVLTLSRRKRR